MHGYLAADGLPLFVESYCVRAPGYAPFTFDPWQSASEYFDEPPAEAVLRAGREATNATSDRTRSTCGIPLTPAL
jgi:hypothetical protein